MILRAETESLEGKVHLISNTGFITALMSEMKEYQNWSNIVFLFKTLIKASTCSVPVRDENPVLLCGHAQRYGHSTVTPSDSSKPSSRGHSHIHKPQHR